jgi:hypothetical protein
MKKIFLLLVTPFLAFATFAQNVKIKVEEKSENIGGGSHNCLVVTIYDASADDIKKEWKSKMKDYNAKVTSGDEIFADNALIKDISDNTCDVYAKTEKGGADNETKFIVGFVLGETWLSSSANSASYKAAEKIVKDFAMKMTKDAIGDIVAAEQKKLDKLNDEQKDLVKDNKNLNDDIAEYQKKIDKAKSDIKTNEDDQAKKKSEIDAQQKVLDAAKARQNSVE